jgi:alpha-tubulin suppressor-like RCC1 family protein
MNGTLWCWGGNGSGQLGQGDATSRTNPTQVGALTAWATISAGNFNVCGTRTDGTLWCWGLNTDGELRDVS